MRDETEETMRDWLARLGPGNSDVELKVFRLEPEVWNKIKIKGHQRTFTGNVSEVDEDVLRREFGGGTYRLMLRIPDPATGKLLFFGNKHVEIPGPPNMTEWEEGQQQNGTSRNEDPSVSAQALDMVRDLYFKNQQQSRNGNGQESMAMFQTMMEMMRMSQKDRDTLQERFLGFMAQPKDDTNGKLLSTMLTQESARIQSMEANHQSELRMLKEGHGQELKRLEDRYERHISMLQADHRSQLEELRRGREMEVGSIRESKANEIKYADMARQATIDNLNREIERQNREIAKLEVELTALKAQKNQSLPEKAEEITSMMEAIKSLGFGGGDDEPKGRLDKLLDAVTSPQILNRIMGAAGGQAVAPQAQPQQLMPAGLKPLGAPFQGPDGNTYAPFEDGEGNVYLRDPAGQLHQLSPEDGEQIRATHGTAGEATEEGPTDEQVKMAAAYLESAMAGNTEPEILAVSVRAVIPSTMIEYLEQHGADAFIARALKLNPQSKLKSQAGHNYVRKVAESLLG